MRRLAAAIGAAAIMFAPTAHAQGLAHFRLWQCIHSGAYPGAPHEGSSPYSRYHPYSGPLQMRPGWEGYAITDWSTLPPIAVYAIAEQQYRYHGYSRAWLYGQWGATAPPCANFA